MGFRGFDWKREWLRVDQRFKWKTQGWIKSPSGFITSQTKTNKRCFTVWLQILSQKETTFFLDFSLLVPLVLYTRFISTSLLFQVRQKLPWKTSVIFPYILPLFSLSRVIFFLSGGNKNKWGRFQRMQ